MTTINTVFTTGPSVTNHLALLDLTSNCNNDAELGTALVSDAKLAFTALAEICIRNPRRVERTPIGFSRRDRNVGFSLGEKFLTREALSVEEVLCAVNLAYRYRKQIASLCAFAPEVSMDETEVVTVEL